MEIKEENIVNLIFINKEYLLNAILVNEGVRPAMLIQTSEFKEKTGKDINMIKLIRYIKEIFPDLIDSSEYEGYQGAIISKKNYNGKIINSKKMGKILGYPYYRDFPVHIDTPERYRILLRAELKINDSYEYIELFVNVAKDLLKIEEFYTYADKANEVFKSMKYIDILKKIKINEINIDVDIEKKISINSIIRKLLSNVILDSSDKTEILNILYNMDFILYDDYESIIQYDNPIHKGILLQLLISAKNDLLKPFYPLQYFPKEYKKVLKITKKKEKDFIDILEKSRV